MEGIEELLSLKGKTAVVTGGASGIGLGIVKRLAQAGANIVIADLNENAAKLAVEELNKLGQTGLALKCDVSSQSSIEDLIAMTVHTFGSIDILVNNAGIYPHTPLMSLETEEFDKVININLRSVFLASKAAAKVMIEKNSGGKIINTSSIDSMHPSHIGLAAYDASKHGIWGITKEMALELAPYKIAVNAVAPGNIETPGKLQANREVVANSAGSLNLEKLQKERLIKIPMGRMGTPDDIAKVVLFLASDMSSYITGSQIVADGGVLLS